MTIPPRTRWLGLGNAAATRRDGRKASTASTDRPRLLRSSRQRRGGSIGQLVLPRTLAISLPSSSLERDFWRRRLAAKRGPKTMSPQRDRKSETTTREKWP